MCLPWTPEGGVGARGSPWISLPAEGRNPRQHGVAKPGSFEVTFIKGVVCDLLGYQVLVPVFAFLCFFWGGEGNSSKTSPPQNSSAFFCSKNTKCLNPCHPWDDCTFTYMNGRF